MEYLQLLAHVGFYSWRWAALGDSGGLAIWADFPGCICFASSSFLIRAGEVMAQSIKCFAAQA